MSKYQLLPFRFQKFDSEQMLIVNEVGEFFFIPLKDFADLVSNNLDVKKSIFLDLKSKHFTTDTEIEPVIKMLATKYRTKKSFLYNFTSLHMVVPTLRCNSKCIYCQVSSKKTDDMKYDMNEATAKRVVDMIFCSPSLSVKIEFQGGEPLLNFKIVKYIIEYAEKCNSRHHKQLEFVICSNLTLINDEMLHYLKDHNVYISTSLDGPKFLHDKNRPLKTGLGNYDTVVENIYKVRQHLGEKSVSALMTTTKESLEYVQAIIDNYITLGFDSLFLRSLNPYGFAKRDWSEIGYNIENFINFYKEALNHIIDVNLRGTFFVENYTTLLLTRILTPFSTGFVDLQSPAGVVISGVIYDFNGNVYVADEGRMLSYEGDYTFLMGNVHQNSYNELFHSDNVVLLLKKSCLECLPRCSHCVYQSYCGADPVRNYAEQGDIIGNRMSSSSCKKNMSMIRHLFEIIRENQRDKMDVFWSWITRRPLIEKSKC
ncbi:MAG: His-Xaa-Ser system radical SAM maturase HxsB [Nitrospirae bacterium]|nr:His-Xaa-Ser system radical SAM maturase HxsB [Nitrospirota bacterium]